MKSTGKRTVTKPHRERKLNPETVGGRIWLRREELQMTREELAKRLNVEFQKLWRIETNQTRLPADDLPAYAKILKTTVEALVA